MKKIFLTLLLLINGVSATPKITQANELKVSYKTIIKPYFDNKKLNHFISYDGLKIAYKYFPVKNSKATIVISTGRTEGMVKYPELLYDLNNNGYSVYIYDHRGQGFSQRMTIDSQLGHVKDFFNYVKDLKYFVDNIVKHDKKLFLLSHSMGGQVATLYAQAYTDDFDAIVLSSPMHQPKLLSALTTEFLCDTVEYMLDDSPKYIIGKFYFDFADNRFLFNVLTHSRLRFSIMNESYELNPETKIGWTSVNWVLESCKVSPLALKHADNIKVPVLLIQAGNDYLVNLKPHEKFCKNMGSLCKIITIDDAYHELFFEKDIYRNKALSVMFEFFEKNL